MKSFISLLSICLIVFGAVPALAQESSPKVANNITVSTSPYDFSSPMLTSIDSNGTGITVEVIPKNVAQLGPIQQTLVDIEINVVESGRTVLTLLFENCSYQTYHNSIDEYYYHYWTDVHDNYKITYYASGYDVVDVSHTISNTNVEGSKSRVTYRIVYDYNNGSDTIDYVDVYAPVNN